MHPKPQGSRTLCVVLFTVGVAALAISLIANSLFGSSLGKSVEGKWLQAASSVTIDVTFAALGLVAGLLWRNRARGAAVGVGVLCAMFGLYTLTGIVGFGAAERIAKAEETKAKAGAMAKQATIYNQTARDYRDQNLSFLRTQYASARKDEDKSRLLDQIAKASTPPEIKLIVDIPTLADPQAMTFNTLTGIDAERIQLGLVIWLAVLLVIAKMVAFTLATALWPRPLPTDVPVAANDAVPVAAPQPIVAPAGKASVPIVAKVDDKQIVADWQRTSTVARAGARVTAETAYQWFVQWALARNVRPMSQSRFGKLLAELGVQKQHDGRVVHYLGMAPALQLAA